MSKPWIKVPSNLVIFLADWLNKIATSRLQRFYWNIRFLINYSIFLGRWSFRETGLSTKMLTYKSFSGINLLQCLFVYLAKFSGRFHLNVSCFGTTRNLLTCLYSPSPFSNTLRTRSDPSLCFVEGFSLVASLAENLDGCSGVFPWLVSAWNYCVLFIISDSLCWTRVDLHQRLANSLTCFFFLNKIRFWVDPAAV